MDNRARRTIEGFLDLADIFGNPTIQIRCCKFHAGTDESGVKIFLESPLQRLLQKFHQGFFSELFWNHFLGYLTRFLSYFFTTFFLVFWIPPAFFQDLFSTILPCKSFWGSSFLFNLSPCKSLVGLLLRFFVGFRPWIITRSSQEFL